MNFLRLIGFVLMSLSSCKSGFKNHNNYTAATTADNSFIVLLDAGHGGKDGGAVSNFKLASGKPGLEKDIAFSIAQKVDSLCKHENIKIYLTRDKDTFILLKKRLIISKNIRPNLFLSLHVNEYDLDPKIRGTEFYCVNKNNPYYVQSLEFINNLQENLGKLPFIKIRGIKKSPTRIFLLHNSICPATLTELGYIFNQDDFNFLTNPASQQKIATAITKAIVQFKENTKFADYRLDKRMPFDKNYRTIQRTQAMGDFPVVLVNGVEYNSELLTEIDTTKIAQVAVRPPIPSDFTKYGFIAKDSIIELTLKNNDSPFIFRTEEEKKDFWIIKNKSIN